MTAGGVDLLDTAACGILQTDERGTFQRVNRTFCTWLGYAPEALIGKRRLQELFTVGGRIFHQTHWAPLLQMQGSVSEVKLDVVHSDGTMVPMVLNAVRRTLEGAVAHDIAAFVARDRDRYERELLLSRKRLEEMVAEATTLQAVANDRALLAEEMIGIVSHDLRNPLSSISLGSALLARGELSEGQQRTLQRVVRSTERANRLIADLLDFTQARIGRALSVSLETIDVHEAVAHAVDELAHVYPGRALRHLREGQGASPADANRLAQLVGNLVSNAMVYGKPDAAVTVTSRIDATSFSIAVHNDGAPIPQEIQTRIFQPMTRGTTASSAARSVGLGLFIVREIAKAHGGTAAVASSADAGTTFTAVFPRA
jgi:sigma-B regulation protein RsbU (phosphoserine phosphatase)